MNFLNPVLALILTSSATYTYSAGRDTINIVGSSTVYPFATTVAETFGKKTDFKSPKIESTGSGGGMKLFCTGTGTDTPDVTNSSRRIKKSELEMCHKNGVSQVVEALVGFDGIVIANSVDATDFELGLKDIYLALAKDVPASDGSEALVANPYMTWSDINPALPAIKIEVLGPPPTSGTRDAFVELAMEGGCKQYNFINAMGKSDKSAYKSACHTIREDGAYIEAGENDNLIVQKLDKNPNALGIFGYSFLEENSDKVKGTLIDGVAPEFESIADDSYPISRPLYFYIKSAHIGTIPGLLEFVEEFFSEDAMGDDGYLSEKGLIPMSEEDRAKWKEQVLNLTNLAF